MKTGDGPTEDGNRATRNEENVIRLPRDWLGPREELVPIGPAARARAAQLEIGDASPPSADAFWSEDSAALHDAVQAPDVGAAHRPSPPVGLVAPVAGKRHLRLHRPPGLRSVRVGRGGWALLAGPAVVVAALAVLALAARPAGHRTAARTGAVHEHNTTVAQDSAASDSMTSPTADTGASGHRSHPAARAHARPRARHKVAAKSGPARKSHVVHKSPQPVSITHGTAAPTVTEASVTPVTETQTTPAGTASSVSDQSSETASTGSSEGSKRSTSPGPIGIGSMTGRCNPRCP